jgi:hypothetical protein
VPAPRSPVDDWTTTPRALAAAVAAAVGIDVPPGAIDPAGVDWPRFTALTARHAVAPLVRRSPWLAARPVPSDVDRRLHVAARRCATGTVRALAAMGEIVTTARAEGIDVVVLDGAPLAVWAYGDPLARHGADVRLLVAPDRLGALAALLGRLGLDPLEPVRAGADELTFMGDSTFVEVRPRLFANRALLPLDAADPRHRMGVDVGGLAVTTLAPEAAWWFAAVGGTAQRWGSLKLLADVPAVLGACPELLAPDALARATAAGLDRCVATALTLAADVLGMPLPVAAADWLAARRVRPALARSSRRCLAAGAESAGADGEVMPAHPVVRAAGDLQLRADRRYRWAALRLAAVRVVFTAVGPAVERAERGGWDRHLARPEAWARAAGRRIRRRPAIGGAGDPDRAADERATGIFVRSMTARSP